MELYATYATICNYMTNRCGNSNFIQLNSIICNCVGTILKRMQLYATILQLYETYATILQQFCMQLYENMKLYAIMQHATYAT